jgi:hypothetical protein
VATEIGEIPLACNFKSALVSMNETVKWLFPLLCLVVVTLNCFAQAPESEIGPVDLRLVPERINDKHLYSMEWGTLYHYGGLPQASGHFRLDGQRLDWPSGLRFYALQSFQKPFQGGQGTFDQGNYYYFSHINTDRDEILTLGITHDKAETSNDTRKYRYNKGGMSLTTLYGKHWFTTKTVLRVFRLYADARAGAMISFNDIHADISLRNEGLPFQIQSAKRGRSYSGMGLLGCVGGGINCRINHAFSIGIGVNFTGFWGYTREAVYVNGFTGGRLRIGFGGITANYPVIQLIF